MAQNTHKRAGSAPESTWEEALPDSADGFLEIDSSDAEPTSVLSGNKLAQLLVSQKAIPSVPPQVFQLDAAETAPASQSAHPAASGEVPKVIVQSSGIAPESARVPTESGETQPPAPDTPAHKTYLNEDFGDDEATCFLTPKDEDATRILPPKDDGATCYLTPQDDEATCFLTPKDEDATRILPPKDSGLTLKVAPAHGASLVASDAAAVAPPAPSKPHPALFSAAPHGDDPLGGAPNDAGAVPNFREGIYRLPLLTLATMVAAGFALFLSTR